MDLTVRRARGADVDRVRAFTSDTWPDREVGDYVGDAMEEWTRADRADRLTLVCEAAGTVVGVVRGALLTDHEAWASGLRVAPDHRDEGVGTRLTRAVLAWARDRGASVCRNLVFSWNAPSLGLSRLTGFEPCASVRFVSVEADAGAGNDPGTDRTDARPDDGWAFWSGSDARTALRGLALDAAEPWAVSELTRERLHDAAADDRLVTVGGDGTRGVTCRVRTRRYREDGPLLAEYAVGAWADPAAAGRLLDAVRRDAAAAGADRGRVLVPEGVRWATDAASAHAALDDAPHFLLAADLAAVDPAAEAASW
ncbi:MAG: N-acetyltransferase family protein [Haloferacaceae archaeon]